MPGPTHVLEPIGLALCGPMSVIPCRLWSQVGAEGFREQNAVIALEIPVIRIHINRFQGGTGERVTGRFAIGDEIADIFRELEVLQTGTTVEQIAIQGGDVARLGCCSCRTHFRSISSSLRQGLR